MAFADACPQGEPGLRGEIMFLGYNTNGFAHHRLEDAIAIIAELGYSGIALTPDVNHLDIVEWERRSDRGASGRIQAIANALAASGLECVIETGARFILDPRAKHQPTLLSPDPDGVQCRLSFLSYCVDLAARFQAPFVSFWSGTPLRDPSASPRELMFRLAEGCKHLADYAASQDVRLAFEPEPGMFIDTMEKFAELHGLVNHPAFGLTVDVGHLVCNNELPASRFLKDWKHVLWNVHIEDMKRGIHDHLVFGEGEVDFADVFTGLKEANYRGGVFVELSRHSYDAVNTARKARAFLDPYLEKR